MKWGNPVARRHSHSRGNIERNFTLTGAGTPDLQPLQNTLSVTTASRYSGYISQSEEIVIASSWSLATKYIVLVIVNNMGQQESTYRKFDDKSRRKVKLVNKEENNNKENTEEKSEKKRKEKNFSLLNFSWRSGMSNVNTGEDMESWPGWYHGWCNRGQVRVNSVLEMFTAKIIEL